MHPALIRPAQGGNALFLILIAVALFAALSYAITQSSRSGSGSVTRETNALQAARTVQMAATLRTAALRLQMSGVKVTDMKLIADGSDPTSPCTETDGTCLFTPEGGGATFPRVGKEVPAEIYDQGLDQFKSDNGIPSIAVIEAKTNSGGTVVLGAGSNTGPDAGVAILGIRKDVCEAINKGLGIAGIPLLDMTLYISTQPDYNTADIGGKIEGCINAAGMFGQDFYEYVAVIGEN